MKTIENIITTIRETLATCWIPVSLGLPTDPDHYLITESDGNAYKVYWDGEDFSPSHSGYVAKHITHWMPIPGKPLPRNFALNPLS